MAYEVTVVLKSENGSVLDSFTQVGENITKIVHNAISNRRWTFEDGDTIAIYVDSRIYLCK